MSEEQIKSKPKRTRLYWLLAIFFSLLIHIGILLHLKYKAPDLSTQTDSLPKDYVKFSLPKKEIAKKDKDKEKDEESKRILEAPLAPTEKPDEVDFLGQNDHKAQKKMKVKKREYEKAADPGLSKSVVKTFKSPESSSKRGDSQSESKEKALTKSTTKLPPGIGKKQDTKQQTRGAKAYEDLLAKASESFSEAEMNKGYMDHLNDLVEEGETIDMNTREYRFIGYFTGLRKAIELVWVYPSEAARRGQSGHVLVKFIILQDGKIQKVQVLQTSGYPILDDAIVDAIRSAAPYAPLPKGFQKERLVVSGQFSYVLGNY